MHTPPAAPTASNRKNSPSPEKSSSVETRSTEIGALADNAVIERVDALSRLERCNTLEVLLYLVEVDRRKLWRGLEFRSMFDYCIRRLRYSEAAASRRIRTARLIGRYPHVYRRIRDGRLSLCAVAKIARAVVDDGRVDLIEQIEGKRLDQIDAILATHRNPSRPVRESIRLLCVERRVDGSDPETTAPQLRAASGAGPGGMGTDAGAPANAGEQSEPPPGDASVAGPGGSSEGDPLSTDQPPVHDANGGGTRTRIERVFRFQFGIDADTMTKFARVQSIAARRAGHHVDLSELFGMLCDTYLDRYDATTRSKRRGGRKGTGSQGSTESHNRRYVGPGVRDSVIRRDGGRCTFVDRNGDRCTETIALQVDHVRPHALGGGNDLSNLRAMCSAHNRLLAERTFGRATVERAIAARRPADS